MAKLSIKAERPQTSFSAVVALCLCPGFFPPAPHMTYYSHCAHTNYYHTEYFYWFIVDDKKGLGHEVKKANNSKQEQSELLWTRFSFIGGRQKQNNIK